jgi:hypothetical protein
MASLAAFLIVATGLIQGQPAQDPPKKLPTTVGFRVPKDSSAADIKLAAKALQKRCDEVGYKGVAITTPESEGIVLECKSGIPDAMMNSLRTMAALAATTVELRFFAEITTREREQYVPGDKAPNGVEWLKDQNPEWTKHGFAKKVGKSPDWWLVRKTPRFDVRVKWKPAASGWSRELVSGMRWVRQAQEKDVKTFNDLPNFPNENFFEFDSSTSKALYGIPEDCWGSCALFVDGAFLSAGKDFIYHPGRSDGKSRWNHEWSKIDILGVSLNNPMPFPLSIVSEY